METERNKQETRYKDYVQKKKQLETQVQKRLQQAYRLKKGNGKKLSLSDKKSLGRTDHGAMEKKKARSANSLKKRIGRMQAPQKIEKNRELKFVASEYEQISGNSMLTINNLNVFREEKMLIQGINLKVSAGDKVAVIGPNKSGKTTFFETILSKPKQVKWNKFAKVGYFAQDLNNLDFDKSLWENIKKGSNQSQQFIYDLLGEIGFSAPQFNQLTASLSGGEIVKANLARILVGDYNFLMLDEPTNYLDLQAIHALTDFLINYPNTVLLISHDQVFTNKVSKRIYVVKNKRLINHKALNIGKTEKAQKILLEYELDNLINDPSSNIDQIRKIRSQIDHS